MRNKSLGKHSMFPTLRRHFAGAQEFKVSLESPQSGFMTFCRSKSQCDPVPLAAIQLPERFFRLLRTIEGLQEIVGHFQLTRGVGIRPFAVLLRPHDVPQPDLLHPSLFDQTLRV
jgi:hypothetical protein